MHSADLLGLLLVGLSAVLLAAQWQGDRAAGRGATEELPGWYRRQRRRRRTLAGVLIGVLGLALLLEGHIPHTPWPVTLYLFAITIGTCWVLGLGIADMLATHRFHHSQTIDRLAKELRRADPSLAAGNRRQETGNSTDE